MKTKLIYLAIVSLVVVALDQVTKNYILDAFQYGESMDVINNFFNITYVRNYGAAFGMLSKVDPSLRDTFFLMMPPFAMTVILIMLKMAHGHETLRKISLCAVFAGALGNYIDRVRFGYVVDFLDFHYYEVYAWPAFNVADMSIVCGVSVLILLELISPTESSKKA